jgi:hypothetical protein
MGWMDGRTDEGVMLICEWRGGWSRQGSVWVKAPYPHHDDQARQILEGIIESYHLCVLQIPELRVNIATGF